MQRQIGIRFRMVGHPEVIYMSEKSECRTSDLRRNDWPPSAISVRASPGPSFWPIWRKASARKIRCPRERQVLQLIAEGKANKETAFELGIGIKTVEKHREHLMEKLDIHDTAGLTRYAISAGVIESSVQLTIV